MLKDSGARREFSTGAVRDIAVGKGRTDLLPHKQVAHIIGMTEPDVAEVLLYIDHFMITGSVFDIEFAVQMFIKNIWKIDPCSAYIEVSKQYEEGALKYSERNWQKGMPCHCFVDSGIRHMLKYVRGDDDEPHQRAFVWNMLGLLWMIENHPEMNDLPFANINK